MDEQILYIYHGYIYLRGFLLQRCTSVLAETVLRQPEVLMEKKVMVHTEAMAKMHIEGLSTHGRQDLLYLERQGQGTHSRLWYTQVQMREDASMEVDLEQIFKIRFSLLTFA